MALTQVSTNGIKNGTITGSDLATNVDLVDDQKLRLGTGNDLQISHDGSNSLIADVGTGALVLKSNQIDFIDSTSTEFLARFFENSAIELYFDSSKRIATTTTGMSVTRQNAGEYFNINANYGASGDQAIECSGDLTFYTNGSSIAARLDQDGLKFNADTAAVNALDDYEEGTFTATCSNGVTLHSSQDLCTYTKIGRQVTVRGQVRVNDENGGNQDFIITNLPFVNQSGDGEGSSSTVGAVRIWDQNIPSNAIDVVCVADGNDNDLDFWINRDDASGERMKANSNAYALFTITYFAN